MNQNFLIHTLFEIGKTNLNFGGSFNKFGQLVGKKEKHSFLLFKIHNILTKTGRQIIEIVKLHICDFSNKKNLCEKLLFFTLFGTQENVLCFNFLQNINKLYALNLE